MFWVSIFLKQALSFMLKRLEKFAVQVTCIDGVLFAFEVQIFFNFHRDIMSSAPMLSR